MTRILIVDNKNGRNEQFLPLFVSLNVNGIGKLVENKHYIIDSDRMFAENDVKITIFNRIQQVSQLKGFSYVMYSIKQ